MSERVQKVREIICEILELEDDELRDDAVFTDDYKADSLRSVEILAALEKQLRVKIPETELPNMTSLNSVRAVLSRCGLQVA